MNKKLLSVALSGALSCAAQADSGVQVYGTLDVGMIKRSDVSLAIGKRADNTLGIKGSEALAKGVHALFQLEVRYEPDTGSLELGGGGNSRPFLQGQSRVGLQGSFGMIRIGRGLTAFQETSGAFEPFHGVPSPAGFQTDLAVAGYTSDPLGAPGNSANRFSSALFYNSPQFNGFQINTTLATRAANRGAALIGRGSASAPQYASGSKASANPYSIAMTYKNAGAALMVATERNALESQVSSLAVSLMVNPELKLMASYTRQQRDHTVAGDADTSAWVLGGNYIMGPGKLLVGYGNKTDEADSADLKTRQFSLGYEYSLSKRTYLYVDASKKHFPAGASIHHYALGMNHAF
jgi:predicted porin